MISFTDKANFIWSVADLLRGDFKQSEYGKVILPFTESTAFTTFKHRIVSSLYILHTERLHHRRRWSASGTSVRVHAMVGLSCFIPEFGVHPEVSP
jgi:hypothetical protein